jgi:glycosyltransferase involved in cell wall biosynthesis
MITPSGSSKASEERTETEPRHSAVGNYPRVLHFLSEKVRAGIEEHALSILMSLRRHGFEPHLAAPRQLLDQMSEELASVPIPTVAIENASFLDHNSASQFRNYLTKQKIDIVHSHTFRSSIFASPSARIAGVPAIMETYHLPEVWRERKWLKRSYWIDRQLGRFVDRYVAVSRYAENYLISQKGISGEKIQLIYNGRDLNRFHPPTEHERAEARAALGIEDRRAIVVLGRLEEQKGHTFLIEAIARLIPRWPSLVALFAGSGGLKANLMLQRDRAALSKHIEFLGIVPRSEGILAAADVVVLPSLFEGLPLAAIEALACGCPMVATGIGGTREVVIHERTGLLVPPRNPEALANAITRILSDTTFGAHLGENGRRYVERHFDVRTQIERTIQVYRELLDPKEPALAKRRFEPLQVTTRHR